MGDSVGVIYVLTNPSFPDYVKIGYASDMRERLKQLNRSECIPFAFRVYATYEVGTPLQDRELHALIDRLNPDLRAVDMFDGKPRVKEFYAMGPEDAYALLESISRLSGTEGRLRRMPPDGQAVADEGMADSVRRETRARRAAFSFERCGIPSGSRLVLVDRPEITATVLADGRLLCEDETGELMTGTMASFAEMHLDIRKAADGGTFWSHDGRRVSEIRKEREEAGLYA